MRDCSVSATNVIAADTGTLDQSALIIGAPIFI